MILLGSGTLRVSCRWFRSFCGQPFSFDSPRPAIGSSSDPKSAPGSFHQVCSCVHVSNQTTCRGHSAGVETFARSRSTSSRSSYVSPHHSPRTGEVQLRPLSRVTDCSSFRASCRCSVINRAASSALRWRIALKIGR